MDGWISVGFISRWILCHCVAVGLLSVIRLGCDYLIQSGYCLSVTLSVCRRVWFLPLILHLFIAAAKKGKPPLLFCYSSLCPQHVTSEYMSCFWLQSDEATEPEDRGKAGGEKERAGSGIYILKWHIWGQTGAEGQTSTLSSEESLDLSPVVSALIHHADTGISSLVLQRNN